MSDEVERDEAEPGAPGQETTGEPAPAVGGTDAAASGGQVLAWESYDLTSPEVPFHHQVHATQLARNLVLATVLFGGLVFLARVFMSWDLGVWALPVALAGLPVIFALGFGLRALIWSSYVLSNERRELQLLQSYFGSSFRSRLAGFDELKEVYFFSQFIRFGFGPTRRWLRVGLVTLSDDCLFVTPPTDPEQEDELRQQARNLATHLGLPLNEDLGGPDEGGGAGS